MTHRERVLCALSHREPDRVPLDFGGTIDTSISVGGYERLKRRYRFEAENRISSMMMQVVDIDESILKELDIDTRPVSPARRRSPSSRRIDMSTSGGESWSCVPGQRGTTSCGSRCRGISRQRT